MDGQVFDLKEEENKGNDLNSPAFVSNSSTFVVSKTFPGPFYTNLTFIDSYNHVTRTRKYVSKHIDIRWIKVEAIELGRPVSASPSVVNVVEIGETEF